LAVLKLLESKRVAAARAELNVDSETFLTRRYLRYREMRFGADSLTVTETLDPNPSPSPIPISYA